MANLKFICCNCNYGYNEDFIISENDNIVMCLKCNTLFKKNVDGGYNEI